MAAVTAVAGSRQQGARCRVQGAGCRVLVWVKWLSSSGAESKIGLSSIRAEFRAAQGGFRVPRARTALRGFAYGRFRLRNVRNS